MSKTILIVDDSASLRQVAQIALTGAGYDILEACDGRDALTKLDGRRIHLILCDLNMPGMNGIELLKAVKANPTYRFTPVIMLTTENSRERMEEGRAAGAKAWMVKPFQPAALVDTVAKLAPA